MQWVAKAVKYYKDINPATLTGAIDVIVVERPTESGETELACSPFHVRFGKLSVLRPIDKKVRITVNDNPIPFYMKVGETGEAFFVFETDEDLPEDLQTSPLAGPLADSELDGADGDGPPGEPEFLDLGAPETEGMDEQEPEAGDVEENAPRRTSLESSPSSSRYQSTEQTRLNSPMATSQPLPPLPPLIIEGNTAIDTEEEVLSDSAVEAGTSSKLELRQLESRMRKDLEGLSLSEPPAGEAGDDVRWEARRNGKDVKREIGKLSFDEQVSNRIALSNLAGFPGTDSSNDVFGSSPDASAPADKNKDLMLDMSGYKIDPDEAERHDSAKDILESRMGPATEINSPFDERTESQIVAFTQGLLQSVDPKSLRGFYDQGEADGNYSRPTSPAPDEAVLSSFPNSNPTSPALVPIQTPSDSGYESLTSLPPTSKNFYLRVGDSIQTFQLSLCGRDDFGHERIRDELAFSEHQVTFAQLKEQDEITTHSDLVVKYADRFLTWDNASPALASLAVYRKSLIEHPENHPSLDSSDSDRSGRGRGWSLWWRRSAAGSTTSLPTQDISPPTSPPISRPSSPRSLPVPTSPVPVSPITEPARPEDNRHYAKTLRLTSDQLKTLGLKKGKNDIAFSVRSSYSGFAVCTSRIFLWESDFQVVISDIDGTITKSDALGHVFTMIGRDWTHLGVAKLYTDIARNGYKMMYLTSRAIGQADTTREYLKGIKQNGYQLPEGPVIMSPDRLMTSLHREVVLRKPEVFKMACLRDIKRLFGEKSPFYSGFGNRITDALSYRSVDIPSSRVFTIDTNGEVKMELLELAGYKSSYIHMTDLVDQMFPPINQKTAPDYTDFNFWRPPVAQFELPDLSPPSPALSARSDSSRIGFPRLGSLASSLSRRSSRAALTADPAPGRSRAATPSSPLLQATLVEESYGFDMDPDDPSESSTMPGSLPNDGDFERLRAAALRQSGRMTDEESRATATMDEDDVDEDDSYEDGPEGEEAEDADDFGDQLDFSSVPYL